MASLFLRKLVVTAANPGLGLRLQTWAAGRGALPALLPHALPRTPSRELSALLPPSLRIPGAAALGPTAASLLRALPVPALQPAQGFKTKGVLRKRCKDCYRVKRRGRWFIYCTSNPKHKQRQM